MRFLLYLALPSLLWAQASRVDPDYAIQQSPFPNAPRVLATAPGSIVSLCNDNSNPCTSLATTYTDQTMSIQCPFAKQSVSRGTSTCTNVSDTDGTFGFWVGQSATYWYKMIPPTGKIYGPYPITLQAGVGGSYTPPYSGGVTQSIASKLGPQAMSILDFGPTLNQGAIPINSAFTLAQTAAAVTNQVLYIPAGTYLESGTITINTPLQMVCDDGAIFQKATDAVQFVLASSNINISNCQLNGQYAENGFVTDGIVTASSGTFSNWLLSNLTITDMGGVNILIGGTGATMSGINIHGGTFIGSAFDNGGGIIAIHTGVSNLLIDGPGVITQTHPTGNTDGIQIEAAISSGINPFVNIVIRDWVVNWTGGGKIPIEATNHCANPCTFFGGPITIDHVTTNSPGHSYGSGFSYGNGIAHSRVINSTVNGNNSGEPSGCMEVTESSYNTISNNTFIGCSVFTLAGSYNQFSNNKLDGGANIYVGDTPEPASTNNTIVDHNVINMTGQGIGIELNNNTQGFGAIYTVSNTLVEGNIVTFAASASCSGSVECQGIRIENDGATGGMAYNRIINNQFFGCQYPMSFNSAAPGITHTQFIGNVYDTSNFNQSIDLISHVNTDIFADVGTGLQGWWLDNVTLAGSTSGFITIAPNATAGTGVASLPTLSGNDTFCMQTTGNCNGSPAFPTVGITSAVSAPIAPTLTAGTPTGTLTNGQAYFYKYYGVGISGATGLSAEGTFTATSSQSIAIAFPTVTGAIWYNVCRATTTGAESTCFTVPTNNYTDTGDFTAWAHTSGATGTMDVALLSGTGASVYNQTLASPAGRDPLSNGIIHDFTFGEGLGSPLTYDWVSGLGIGARGFTATWADGGKFGPFLQFSGSGQIASTSTTQTLLQSSALYNMTILAWIKQTTQGDIIYRGRAFTVQVDWSLKTTSATVFNFGIGLAGGVQNCASSSDPGGPFNDGNWHLLSATYTQSTGLTSMYEDGQAAGTCTLTSYPLQPNPQFGDLLIGFGGSDLNSDGMVGGISEIRVYGRVLSAAEQTLFYATGR